jgi:hypothetical protein
MKKLNLFRLQASGWKPSISTSTHMIYHKKNWQCSINRGTKGICFKRVMKVDAVNLMRGEVEKGIE